ncbi:AAA family ATPase [Dactylosporangium siamense]|uniref:ATPase AAA n=1 Tax=Dactylosporangium siamense TaxID=685454 RepID=A0A919PH61_9ACTN|nr:AAA family ATPase [Dactylosporangium siamense]GIG43859.1 ATPase AAA [Dactylosporangium siamense]
MPWHIFTGNGQPASETEAWRALPPAPPWRDRATAIEHFVIGPELLDAVNTALHLRRPLLLTGAPGSGKSTLVALIAAELQLGEPLAWHITSRSTITDGLYQYDALGRLHATQAQPAGGAAVEQFVTLGPLGTALAAADRPRAVLIDEIDKSDFDLPSDLLTVLDQGSFDVPALVRDAQSGAGSAHRVRGADRAGYTVTNGVIRRSHWPVIVLTSNGERTFPAPFLRRCVRFEIPTATESLIRDVVAGHLSGVEDRERDEIHRFARRLVEGESLALDQLLNFLHLVSGDAAPDPQTRERVARILLEELNGK